ncbi:endopeptidase La [Desulfoluna sp.]|uniref:endopeptidase La n=1 Tax=Desulfoluna sp. TaxID=2045199 RepID=UPI00260759F3|nr:endopeptidase La [Desulfoluna sp.]
MTFNELSSGTLAPEEIPDELSILPVYDVSLFPKMVLPLQLAEGAASALVDDAMRGSRMIGLLLSRKESHEGRHLPSELHTVGTVAMILKRAREDDGKIQMMVQGMGRFSIRDYTQDQPYLRAGVTLVPDILLDDKEAGALATNLLAQYQKVIKLTPSLPQELGEMARSIPAPGTLADMITSTINVSLDEKQEVLELADVRERLQKVTELVNYQLEILEIGTRIQTQVKEDMGNKQKEFYLRQQIKAMQEELGEEGDLAAEVSEYQARIEGTGMPEEAKKEAERELSRLARMPPSSSEYSVATTYLEWVTSLPWQKETQDNLDIPRARKVLDDDHFGLDKPKKRIIEYLAVRKLTQSSKGPILCFAGPPGTGKTSLGRSVARAMGREFIRIAVGGVRDEAEIRGHRRTYVGALPGRIIQGLRRVGSRNPVVVLDEVDKIGSSFQGDPSSALLEVLDPEQNHTFTDHYLDVAFDLSHVMFITTANVLYTIPPALLDRMEVLELPGYTDDEKVKIANRYLIPKQRRAHGLSAGNFSLTKGAVKKIISGYTREAGLRNLEREIAGVCRGAATLIAQEEAKEVAVNVVTVPKFLGTEKYTHDVNDRISVPGVVMGLAWTPAGGEILYIEVTAMKGNKGLNLTGQMGSVMKESVSTALSFVRSNSRALGIDDEIFRTIDLHVHVPAGAIPKDGPSAGVAMMTALVSLLINRVVRKNLAMTGEITLRGKVLPVGGVKEKVLAAHRVGMKTVILPRQNEKDLEELPKKVLKALTIHLVSDMVEVLELAIDRRADEERRRKAQGVRSEQRHGSGERRRPAMASAVKGETMDRRV